MSYVIELTKQNVEEALGHLDCVLAFTATWCQPCKARASVLEAVATASLPIYKVDVEMFPDLGTRYAVNSVPTYLRVTKGIVTATAKGGMDARHLTKCLGLPL